MLIKPSYGIDAPGLVRAFFLAATLFIAVLLASLYSGWPPGVIGASARAVLLLVGMYALGMGCFMVTYSRTVKVVARERLLDLLDFTKVTQVLDLGCGRGLMMIGAAKRMNAGEAVGVDIWLEKDQAGNSPEAALDNAKLEGVADRVKVETADMRKLPYADNAFDVVVSHWALHNIEERDGRFNACQEAFRVLRPGGTVVLADIANHAEYFEALSKIGFAEVTLVDSTWKTTLYALISFGSFKPLAIYGRKPFIGTAA